MRDDVSLKPNKIVSRPTGTGSLASGGAPNMSLGTFAFQAQGVSMRNCFHPSTAGEDAIGSLVLGKKGWRR